MVVLPMNSLEARLRALEPASQSVTGANNNGKQSLGFEALDVDAAWAESLKPKQYVVDKWLGKVGTSLWVAPPKTGKSTMVRALCAHVQNGLPFGTRAVTQGNALYLSTQEAAEDMITLFRQYNIGPKIGEPFEKKHLPSIIGKAQFFKARTLKDRANSMLDVLNDELTKHGKGHYSFVVTDMLLDIAEIKEANNTSEANERLSIIANLAVTHGTHIAPVYHANKRDVDMLEGDPLMSVSGANSLAGGVDDVFVFAKKAIGKAGAGSLRRWLTSVGRFSGGNNPWRELEYNEATGLVTIGQTWSGFSGTVAEGPTSYDKRKDTANRERKAALLGTLRRVSATEDEPVERSWAFNNTTGDVNDLRATWRELLAAGEVGEKTQGGRSALVWLVPKPCVIEFPMPDSV
jgi:hypothetical protein